VPRSPVAAVVLAAGLCRRFGSAKLLAIWQGRPIVAHVLDRVAAARDDGLLKGAVVVHRPDDLETPRMARERHLEPLLNPRPARGMASSLRLGLTALGQASWQPLEGAMVVLGDQPLLRQAVLESLVKKFRPSMDLIRPQYQGDPSGSPGHPVIVHRRIWDKVKSLTGDQGFRVLATWGDVRLGTITVPGVNPDVDTPEDLVALDQQAGVADG
jgi:molybdenum cofactor cytidylyltransferase